MPARSSTFPIESRLFLVLVIPWLAEWFKFSSAGIMAWRADRDLLVVSIARVVVLLTSRSWPTLALVSVNLAIKLLAVSEPFSTRPIVLAELAALYTSVSTNA